MSDSSWRKVVQRRCERLGVDIKPNRWHRYDDVTVIAAAQNAHSTTEVMRRLNLKPAGYSHARFKQRLAALGFTYPNAAAWNTGVVFGPKRELSEYLVKNGPAIGSSKLRCRLIKEGYKENKCESCGITEWRGKPISLHLEHKDGGHTNNEMQNIEILCPNCHLQTPTYAKIKNTKTRRCECGIKISPYSVSGKCRRCSAKDGAVPIIYNKVVKKYERIQHFCLCGAPVVKNSLSKLCRKCWLAKQPNKIPPKDELAKLLWEIPTTKIAIKYGVSDKAVEKWCRKFGLSKPKPGYWRKLETGHSG